MKTEVILLSAEGAKVNSFYYVLIFYYAASLFFFSKTGRRTICASNGEKISDTVFLFFPPLFCSFL